MQFELRQIRDHNAGAVVKELIGMRADTDTDDEAEASSVASLDAGQGVFHHCGSGGSDIESPRRSDEDGRIGLARQLEGLGVYTIDDGIEEIVMRAVSSIALACRLDEIRAVRMPWERRVRRKTMVDRRDSLRLRPLPVRSRDP